MRCSAEKGDFVMPQDNFASWIMEGGQVAIPCKLLDELHVLNISPENLGYLILAMSRSQQCKNITELSKDCWIKWSIAEGWAKWEGKGKDKYLTFAPVWKSLHNTWLENVKNIEASCTQQGDFDYNKILKWLDQVRGTLSVTLREKQVIQELNLKYGWSTDFILIFLQLAFERGQNQAQVYQGLAKKVYQNSIDTVDGLVAFMSDLDWIHYQVTDVKKCVGQYGGVTKPQREMYLKWNKKWKFGHEIIMRAAQETVRTNNPNFNYIDGILKNWYEKGVLDMQGAEQALLEHDQQHQVSQNKKSNNKRISRADNRDWEKMLGVD